jgi:hypothetical protein
MSTPVNYFLGLKRGAPLNVNQVVAGTSTSGSAVDVELRLQIDNGTNTTGLTRKDVMIAIEILQSFIQSGGNNHDGQNLPAL